MSRDLNFDSDGMGDGMDTDEYYGAMGRFEDGRFGDDRREFNFKKESLLHKDFSNDFGDIFDPDNKPPKPSKK